METSPLIKHIFTEEEEGEKEGQRNVARGKQSESLKAPWHWEALGFGPTGTEQQTGSALQVATHTPSFYWCSTKWNQTGELDRLKRVEREQGHLKNALNNLDEVMQ